MSLDEYRAGSTEPWTVDLLCALVRAKKPYLVLETGTFEARTSCALVTAMNSYSAEHSSVLYTVESDRARFDAAAARLDEHRHSLGANVGINVVCGDALELLMLPRLHGTVDFVFLDDDHTAAHVHAELKWAAEALRPGGLCCVHDVIGPFGLDKVVESYGGIILDLPRLHAAGGLGVVSKH